MAPRRLVPARNADETQREGEMRSANKMYACKIKAARDAKKGRPLRDAGACAERDAWHG